MRAMSGVPWAGTGNGLDAGGERWEKQGGSQVSSTGGRDGLGMKACVRSSFSERVMSRFSRMMQVQEPIRCPLASILLVPVALPPLSMP